MNKAFENLIAKKEESNTSKKKLSPFDYSAKIYDIIESERELSNLDNLIEELFSEADDSTINFVGWILNHNLVYNQFMRNSAELFFSVNAFMPGIDYIKFYILFAIKNKIKFPKYMRWYKIGIGNDPKKYNDILKEDFNMNDEEIENFVSYLTSIGSSLREFCLNLQYIEE